MTTSVSVMAASRRFDCSSSSRDGALAPDPESRDSGFDAAHRPGMTFSLLSEDVNVSPAPSDDFGSASPALPAALHYAPLRVPARALPESRRPPGSSRS